MKQPELEMEKEHLAQVTLVSAPAGALTLSANLELMSSEARAVQSDLPLLELQTGRLIEAQAPRGWTSGTDGPNACLNFTLDRSRRVPKQASASGNTTLKFLCM